MKKIFSVFLASALIITSLNLSVFAEEVSSEEVPVTVSEENDVPLGFSSLSSAQVLEKKELLSCIDDIKEDKEGEDYEDNRICYMADTQEEAEKIASFFGAELVFYQYGVASALLNHGETPALGSDEDEYMTVEEAVELSASPSNNLPAVYPDYIVKLNEEALSDTNNETVSEEISALGEAAVRSCSTDDEYTDAQYYHDYIKDYKAWEKGITGKGITIAVIDTGVNCDHPDLAANITDFKLNVIAADKSIDLEDPGLAFETDINDPDDFNGHGTHCSGIIAAVANNGIGGTGVAPDVKIMPIKVMAADGYGNTSWVVAGMNAAVANGADILSMSLGGTYSCYIQKKAVEDAISKGVIIVSAAGNENSINEEYPADDDNVISVASLAASSDYADQDSSPIYGTNPETGESMNELAVRQKKFEDRVNYLRKIDTSKKLIPSCFTNYYRSISIAAPGSGIFSTFCDKRYDPNEKKYSDVNQKYALMCGTSQATPIVSGAIALLLSAHPEIQELDGANVSNTVENILKETSNYDYLTKCTFIMEEETYEIDLHCGRLDIEKALNFDINGDVTKPVFEIDKSEDGYYISGEDKILKISTEKGIVKYTDDGRDPVRYGKAYPEGGIKLNFSGKKTFRAVSVMENNYSEEASFTAEFFAPITKIESYGAINILPGKSDEVHIFVYPEYSNIKSYEFTSSDPNVFTVNSEGIVKANKNAKEGQTALITVRDNISGCEIQVDAKITGSKQQIIIPEILRNNYKFDTDDIVNLTELFNEVGIDTDSLIFTSSNTKAAYLIYEKDENNKVNVYLKNVSYGKSKITVEARDGSGEKKSFQVKCANPIYDIRLTTDTGYISTSDDLYPAKAYIGATKSKVKITADHNIDDYVKKAKTIEYSSSDSNIVKVSKSGVVTPGKNAKPGDSAIITAKSGELETQMEFIVVNPLKDMTFIYDYSKAGVNKTAKVKTVSATITGNKFKLSDYDKYNNTGKGITLNSLLMDYPTVYSEGMDIVSAYESGRSPEGFLSFEYAGKEPATEKVIFDKETKKIKDIEFTFTSKGKYNITLKPRDGSGKKITIKLTVK